MNDERYSIIYSSRTGNTRLLAEAIRESLPADLCDHFGTDEAGAVESEKLYVGFWTDKGTADEAALALLKRLKTRKFSCSVRRASAKARRIFKRCWIG